MSVGFASLGAIYERESAGPIWKFGVYSATNITVNEGDTFNFALQLVNPVVGSRMIGATYNNSGNAMADSNFVEPLTTVFQRVCSANGITVKQLGQTTDPKGVYTRSWEFSMDAGSTYDGSILVFPVTVRNNRKDDVDPRASTLINQTAYSGDPDVIRSWGSNVITIRDTSKTPTGSPKFLVAANALDGVSQAKTTYVPGDGFKLTVTGQNIVPGTKIKMYAAGAAQYFLNPSFRGAMNAAISPSAAPPGITYEQTKYPPPTGQVWYNGYTIVFGDDYVGDPISWNLIFSKANDDGTSAELDIISTVMVEGAISDLAVGLDKGNYASTSTYSEGDLVTDSSTGQRYAALQIVPKNSPPASSPNFWRPYTPTQIGSIGAIFSRLPPARYWEIRAVSDGTTIRYGLNVPVITTPDTVQLSVTNAPPGFAAALANVASASGSPVDFDGTTFTVNANASYTNSALIWSVPQAGAGKHIVNLSNNTGAGFMLNGQPAPSPITIGDACVYLTAPVLPNDPKFVVGVSNAGGEFGSKMPGTYGTDYRYPADPDLAAPATHAAMDYLWALGFRFMRFPIRSERVQRNGPFTPFSGELPPGGTFDRSTAYDIARVDDIVHYWTGLGGTLLLDVHNYAAGLIDGSGGNIGNKGKIGYDQPVPMTALLDLWKRLVLRYAGIPNIWWGLMNEPNGGGWGPTRCRENMQWLVNYIRAYTDSPNKILVGGTGYSSAMGWVSSGQGDAYADFYDPVDNFAFEPHQYFDADAGGQYGTCVANGQSRLNAVLQWGRQNGMKIFIGETAGGDPAISGQETCGPVLAASYNLMLNNRDVFLGWSTWGFGPRLSENYAYRLDPLTGNYLDYSQDAMRPLMKLLLPYVTEQF